MSSLRWPSRMTRKNNINDMGLAQELIRLSELHE